MAYSGGFLAPNPTMVRSPSVRTPNIFDQLEDQELTRAEAEASRADQLRHTEAEQTLARTKESSLHAAMAEVAPEEDAESFLGNFMRGKLASTPLSEQEDFNNFYDKQKPATEFLS